MGNFSQCACEHQLENNQNSLQKISKSLQVYAYENYIMQYDKPTRQILQKLFVLNQSHVGDRLMYLIKNKNQTQKNIMLNDLLRINLEQFDEICHFNKRNLLVLKNKTKSSTQFVKMSQKYLQIGQQVLRQKKILFIVTAQCFGNQQINIIQKTDLMSRKSRIQLFLQKIQAIKSKYCCKCQVFLICPNKLQPEYTKIVGKNAQVIGFESNLPCFSYKNKIILYGNKIQFNQNQGDLIHFLFTLPTFKNLHEKFDYINFCDLTNYASPAINPIHIGYLSNNKNINLLASVKYQSNNPKQLKVQNNFIDPKQLQFGDILLKTQIIHSIITKKHDLYQILNSRIQTKQMKQHADCYYFSRLPQDLLFLNWAQITKVPYFAHNRFQYSNLCKSIVGIQNQNQTDLVEISPQILHGESRQLNQIRSMLINKSKQFSFPIIITKTKQNL